MGNGVSLRRIKTKIELENKNFFKKEKNKINSLVSNKKQAIFGVHLTIDGYMGDYKLLNDMSIVFKLLNELPEKIGMHKMMPPYVVFAPPLNEKDSGGISGFVMIVESHISVHTFSGKRFVSIDVYTCKNRLPVQFVVNYFKDAFKLQETEVHEIHRGKKFPEKDLI